ncbi:hypothetical protein EI171_30935 [Bradyrhizobium sp. LCT2]|nr:hypothetical protein EI171_30935 [Bradyrhizobium sp. LCT2]
MIIRSILAGALLVPFLTEASMAQNSLRVDEHVYQGGPKSSVPHASRVTDPYSAYGMAGVQSGPGAMYPTIRTPHHYRGGPQTVVPHAY